MNFKKGFLTFVIGLVIIIDIFSQTFITNIYNNNSGDYSISVFSDDYSPDKTEKNNFHLCSHLLYTTILILSSLNFAIS